MIIDRKKFIISAGFVVSFSSIVSASEPRECFMLLPGLEEKVEKLLASDHGDPANEALELIKQSEPCAKTPDDRALLFDLYGEAFHLAYIYSKGEEFFDYSFKAYSKAASLNTIRNEKIYWHISQLMRSAGRHSEAMQYINKVLDMRPKPKDPLPYLETAFQLVVDTKQWDDAKGLMEELSRRDQSFYANPNLLLPTVETLCHINHFDDARRIIKNVEEHVELDEAGKKILEKCKNIVDESEEKKNKLKV